MNSEPSGSGAGPLPDGESPGDPAACAIILVHGTWAPQAAWVKADSLLSRALEEGMSGAIVSPFEWSGKNAHSARIEAGAGLAAFLLALHRKHEIGDFRLVGHSHGGNVILYALRDPQVAPLVRQLAFLGTPFLGIGRRDALDMADQAGGFIAWLLAGLVAAALAWMAVASDVLPVAVMAPAALAIFFLVGKSSASSRFERHLVRRMDADLRRRRDDFADWIETPTPSIPSFVAYVAGDEALFHLGSIDFLTDMQWRTIAAMRSAVPAAAMVFIWGSIVMLVGGWPTPLDSPRRIAWTIPLLVVAVIVAPVAVTLFSRMTRGSSIGFGGEGLISSAALRIKPLRFPPWALPSGSRVHAWRRPATSTGLRHSGLYSDNQLIEDLRGWLQGCYGTHPATDTEAGDVQPPRPIVRRPSFSWRWALFGALMMSAALVWSAAQAEREAAAAEIQTEVTPE